MGWPWVCSRRATQHACSWVQAAHHHLPAFNIYTWVPAAVCLTCRQPLLLCSPRTVCVIMHSTHVELHSTARC